MNIQPDLFTSAPSRPTKRVSVPRTSVLAYQERPRDARVTVALLWLSRALLPVTGAELAAMSYTSDGWPSLAQTMTTRRALSDALAQGLVRHAGTRQCSVSGRVCLTWSIVTR